MVGRLHENEMDELLHRSFFGRIGCSDSSKIYVVPVNFVYDGRHILIHSVEGMKVKMMRKNPLVCFQVDELKDFQNWKSVIVWGEYQELTDTRERYEAMKVFVDRTMKLKISETAIPPELSADRQHPRSPGVIKPVIYRIAITEKTGRFESGSA